MYLKELAHGAYGELCCYDTGRVIDSAESSSVSFWNTVDRMLFFSTGFSLFFLLGFQLTGPSTLGLVNML